MREEREVKYRLGRKEKEVIIEGKWKRKKFKLYEDKGNYV